MDISIALLIIMASFGSALWNIYAKKSDNSLVFVTLMVVPQFIIAAALMLVAPVPSLTTLDYLIFSAVVQTGYIIFLSKAYKHGMLSRVYPLAVGTAPLLSLAFWHVLFGGHFSSLEYAGILLLSFGIISFTFIQKKQTERIHLKAVFYALGTGIFIFGYSLIDTFGIRTVNHPLTYISWLFTIKALMLFLPMLMLKKIKLNTIFHESKNYVFAGLLAGFSYAVAIWGFFRVATPDVLALRSTSILFVFILSILFLQEKASFKLFIFTLLTSMGVFLILGY